MVDYEFFDNMESGQRSCYVGDYLCWRIPFTELELDEEPFGTYADRIAVIHEDEDEPPFIETIGYTLHQPAAVRQYGADFEDWPANKEDPKVSMRLTEWANGEGFDVAFSGGLHTDTPMFSLTWTRFEMLNKLVKVLQEQ